MPQAAVPQSIEEVIDKGYKIIKEGAIDKIQHFLITGDHNVIFTKKDYIMYYT